MTDFLPPGLAARAAPVAVQLLLPTEEASLHPLAASGPEDGEDDERPQHRVAPALWSIPALGLPLADAVPWLATLDAAQQPPGLRALVATSQLVMRLCRRGDFAPAPQPGVLHWVPHWNRDTQWLLAALAELVPGSLCTARFEVPDDPVWAVTQRNFVVSFVGQALDQVLRVAAAGTAPRFDKAERLPREFWQTPMVPVIEILVPERPLEEGVPWGLQVLVRPVPTIAYTETIESAHQRLGASPFPNELATDGVVRVEQTLERVAEKLPALRRARNLSDGRASLTRAELDP
ncbi:MAG: hypothetical protein FJ265_16625, partial [Planctomycetes bacterium]|nr:hypothetical protein [Planctomycetota bacterium]